MRLTNEEDIGDLLKIDVKITQVEILHDTIVTSMSIALKAENKVSDVVVSCLSQTDIKY